MTHSVAPKAGPGEAIKSAPMLIDHEPVFLPLRDGEMGARLYGDPGSPPLLLCHANGFCASTYRQISVRLSARFFVVALDLRGHGRSTLSTSPETHRSYDIHAEDIRTAIQVVSEAYAIDQKWVFAGHSMGAISCLLAAAGRDDVAAVRLVEPVVMPFGMRLLAKTGLFRSFMKQFPLVKSALSRRQVWPDRRTAHDSYSRKALFRDWADGVLADYLEDGLVENGASFELACAPEWEAANFMAQAHDVFGAVRRLKAPLTVMVASRGSTVVPSARAQLNRKGATLAKVSASHLAPMEHPEIIADFLAG